MGVLMCFAARREHSIQRQPLSLRRYVILLLSFVLSAWLVYTLYKRPRLSGVLWVGSPAGVPIACTVTRSCRLQLLGTLAVVFADLYLWLNIHGRRRRGNRVTLHKRLYHRAAEHGRRSTLLRTFSESALSTDASEARKGSQRVRRRARHKKRRSAARSLSERCLGKDASGHGVDDALDGDARALSYSESDSDTGADHLQPPFVLRGAEGRVVDEAMEADKVEAGARAVLSPLRSTRRRRR